MVKARQGDFDQKTISLFTFTAVAIGPSVCFEDTPNPCTTHEPTLVAAICRPTLVAAICRPMRSRQWTIEFRRTFFSHPTHLRLGIVRGPSRNMPQVEIRISFLGNNLEYFHMYTNPRLYASEPGKQLSLLLPDLSQDIIQRSFLES